MNNLLVFISKTTFISLALFSFVLGLSYALLYVYENFGVIASIAFIIILNVSMSVSYKSVTEGEK